MTVNVTPPARRVFVKRLEPKDTAQAGIKEEGQRAAAGAGHGRHGGMY